MKVIRLKHLLKGNFGGVWGDDLDCNENSYTYILRSTEQNENGNWVINWESVTRRNLLRVTNFHTLKKNDIVITKSSGSAGHIGKATLVDENIEKLHCSFSNFMQCLQLDAGKCNPRFYWYYLNSRHCKEQYKISCTTSTGLLNLNSDTFNNLNVPFFSVEYQNQCVAFLDKTISKIEDAIEKHKIQLDFLSSYRQSLITRAVTKGLDPNVEMKDSGVNWIGKIPRNFKTIKLKYCLKSPLQYGATESGCAEEENYIRYIRITDINPSGFLKENGKLYLPKEIAEQYPVKTKDILFARSGATVGKTYFHNNKDDCCFAGYLIKASLSDSKILPKFFYYFTKSACYDFWKDITLSKATIQNISADRLNDLSVVCPPIQDQIQIIKFCDDLINETEAIAEIIKTTCNLLIEYRTSLISAAVTGQLAIEEAAE